MKPFVVFALALSLITSVNAKGNSNANGANNKAQEERKAEAKAREEKEKAIQAYLDGKDKNHDGSISLDEFLASGGTAEEFEKLDLNKSRRLEKDEIAKSLHLDTKVETKKKKK